jgi:hypothetical protein
MREQNLSLSKHRPAEKKGISKRLKTEITTASAYSALFLDRVDILRAIKFGRSRCLGNESSLLG